jgi:PIN domain nuclease of toxin-antitoxin system
MKALLDTPVFLWWNMDDPRLSQTARDLITDGRNELYLSAASAWEIAIKAARGSLILPEPPEQYVPSRMRLHRLLAMPIQFRHALHVYDLPPLHRDPFDRLLIAQSRLEDLPILTLDPEIGRYDVSVIW